MKPLAVHMYGKRIGDLTTSWGLLRFAYSEDAMSHGLGTPLLSVSLPVQRAAYRGGRVECGSPDYDTPVYECVDMAPHDPLGVPSRLRLIPCE